MAPTSIKTQAQAAIKDCWDCGEFSYEIECLATREAGGKHSVWVDLTVVHTPEVFQAVIDALLHSSPTPNPDGWVISETDTVPQCITLMNISDQLRFVEIAQRFENRTREAYVAACATLARLLEADEFEDIYLGEYHSLADFCWCDLEDRGFKSMLENLGAFDLESCIDWDKFWDQSYAKQGFWDTYLSGGKVGVFAPHKGASPL